MIVKCTNRECPNVNIDRELDDDADTRDPLVGRCAACREPLATDDGPLEVDPDPTFPTPTAEEQAAADADAATRIATREELYKRARAARANLVKGADAIKGGTLFAGLTAAERNYLELLGRTAAALVRLELDELDAAD